MLSILTLLTGFLIGYFGHSTHSQCVPNLVSPHSVPSLTAVCALSVPLLLILNINVVCLQAMSLNSVRDENPTIRAKLLNKIKSENIKSIVREFSSQPHRAGEDNDLKLALRVKDYLSANSFTEIETKNYSVLLAVPNDNEPNYFELIDETTNQTIYSSLSSHSVNAYCAYSPSIDIRVS